MMKDFSKLEEYLRADVDRPLGGLQVKSNLEFFDSNHAIEEAADNLLLKARRDLIAGNRARADAYIEKALRLPVNQLTEAPAAQSSVHMMLFMMISDAVESAEEGDTGWLDRALAVLDECEPLAALELQSVLKSVASDYRLEPVESQRIRTMLAGKDDPERALESLIAGGEASVRDLVRQSLDALLRYEQSEYPM